jgi:hypothetical protein
MIESIDDLVAEFKAAPEREKRIVAAVLDNLNDRRGIKQELRVIDGDVLVELGATLAAIVRDTP